MASRVLKVGLLFVLVYAALYLIGLISPLKDWVVTTPDRLDYMLFFVPIAGFFFIYLLIPYLRTEMWFGPNFIMALPVLLMAFGFFAFYVAVYWFYDNQAILSGVNISQFNIDYWQLFLDSHYIYFILASIGGWAARVLIENFDDSESGSGKNVKNQPLA